MLPTTTRRSGPQIALSPREIEQWPHTAAARLPAHAWPKGHPAAFRVPRLDRAVSVCRQLARMWMDREGITDDDARSTALLVISELMTNAILHTNSASIDVHVRKTGDRLLVEVHDEGGAPAVPHPRQSTRAEEYGRGLALVAQAAQEMGTRLDAEGGRTVWAWIPLSEETASMC